jgi:2-polyprenyl-3-methyl-5-hydroxy-6-metoxy-1,4-benzoquinol methylase
MAHNDSMQEQCASRQEKALKIEHILLDHFGTDLLSKSHRCLDLGCSVGIISARLAHLFRQVIGLDPLMQTSHLAEPAASGSGVSFLRGDGLHLPFPDEAFDVIVCAQVYEHVGNPYELIAEIKRTLKPGGVCFFSGPNRLWPIEYHYHWLMLHWLPPHILQRYCMYRYGHPYGLILFNYWQLTSLWGEFRRVDYTLRLVYEPDRFLDAPNRYRLARLIPRPAASLLRFLLPNYNWILVKGAGHTHG